MPFKTPITIKEVVNSIHGRKYLLPSIQRELVWDVDQITALFDSLMRDYPIGSFLLWKVDRDQENNFQFYEFIREYHERNSKHNPKANVDGLGEVTAVLDGQQRFTALYLGMKGSYAYKIPRRRWNDPTAFPKRDLYLNLLSESEEFDMKYDFRFQTKEESEYKDEHIYWFKVGKILEFDASDPSQIWSFLVNEGLSGSKEAGQTLFKLHKVIHTDSIINYFEEEEQDLDKVLRIFVRINSGGTPLSYSDLLLSIATSQWQEKDARDEILNFVDEINNIRDGFLFDKDFVLKSCLVLSDFTDIAFKVTNFNSTNMRTIEKNWESISKAIRIAVSLVASFGFNWQTLASNYAIIPIAYYLLKNKAEVNFIQSSRYKNDRKTINKWLISALLKQIFSGQPDNVLRPIRNILRNHFDSFPFDLIKEELKGTTKSMAFGEEDIENLLSYKYGGRYTFLVLSLLYPNLDYRNQFHQDHISPRNFFTSARKLSRKGIPYEKHNFYLENYNYLANLQLLEGVLNQEKVDKDFKIWFEQTNPTTNSKADYKAKHYIPNLDLSFGNFEEFFNKRKEKLFTKLKEMILG